MALIPYTMERDGAGQVPKGSSGVTRLVLGLL